jgi:hypothetical protein
MSMIVTQPALPRLVLLDTSARQLQRSGLPSEIQFKYQPTDLTIDGVAGAWSSSTGQNREAPILQFSHGEQRGYNFTMKLFAHHRDDSIDNLYRALELSTQKDIELKRPPRWQFIWGTFIDETVIVKTLGSIKVSELRPDGSLHEATCAIQLLVYRSVDVALIAEERPTDTFYAVTKSGDLWEDIALREYDDPSYGDVLRQDNPALLFPGASPGRIVKLPKLENIRDRVIEPRSIPLVRTIAGLALRRQVYSARSVSRQSVVLKK